MEYCYNHASAARKLAVGIAMIALVGYARIGCVEADCGRTAPDPTMPPCRTHYALCVDEVIKGLRETTPKKEGLVDSKSFPGSVHGGVTGSASCVPGTSIGTCRECLFTAKNSLDECKSVSSGSFTNYICTMWFGQIMEKP